MLLFAVENWNGQHAVGSHMTVEYASEPKARAEYNAPWFLRWTEGNIWMALVDTLFLHLLFTSALGLGVSLFTLPANAIILASFLSAIPLLVATTYQYYRVYHYYNPIGYKYSLVPSYTVSFIYTILCFAVYMWLDLI